MDVKLQGIEGSTQGEYGGVEDGVKLARNNKRRNRCLGKCKGTDLMSRVCTG